MGALAGFEKEIDGGKEGTPQAKAHGAAQKNGKSGGQHSGGHNFWPDYSGDPQLDRLVRAKGCGGKAPHPYYKSFQQKRQGGNDEIFAVCYDLCAGVSTGTVGHL